MDDDMEMAFLSMYDGVPNARGALVKMNDKARPGGIMVYFVCEDYSIQESRVVKAGGNVCQPKISIGEWGFISIVNDSEGNTIGLRSLK